MGWLSSISSFLTNDVFNPVNNALGGGAGKGLVSAFDPTAAARNAFSSELDLANATAAKSLKAQQDANLIAAAAAVPQNDSESARAAADDQRRKLASGNSFGIGLPDKFGAPPVGYRLLSGQ